MPLPSPREDVPRDQVHTAVQMMMLNPDVADIRCIEQPDRKYTVQPFAREE